MEIIPFSRHNCVDSLLEAAKKFEISVEEVDQKSELMIFSKNGKHYFVKEHVPDINKYLPSVISSNKALTKRILERADIPVPEGIKESNINRVLDMINSGQLKFPLVVKPVDGSQGEAVTADIKSKEWIKRAIQEVYKYNRRHKGKPNSFLVEKYISGDDFRFLVLGGKVITVLMRKPAYVVGDGAKTILELVEEYNSQPGVAKNQPLCPIVMDYEFKRNLMEQNLSNDSVIKKDNKVFLRKNANVSTGGRSFECFDKAHPKFLELAVKVSKLFDIRFCSVDFIAKNISKFEKFVVIEVNNTPGFDIHEAPFRGKPFKVAEHILRSMFPDIKKGNISLDQ